MLHDTLDTALESTEGAQLRSNGSKAASDNPLGQGEVSRLLSVIADQIAEADRRHGEALTEMKERLQQLGNDARGARPQVPHEFAPAFARIEDALSQLAERITETRAERASAIVAQAAAVNAVEAHAQAAITPHSNVSELATAASEPEPAAPASPMALRSAANPATATAFNWGADFTRSRNGAPAADPFDIVEMDGSAETWSALDAEALTRIYEDDTAARMALPVFETQPPAPVAPEAAEPANEKPLVLPMTAPLPDLSGFPAAQDVKPVSDAAIWADRTWLEGQFSELAERLQASLTEAPAHEMLAALDERLVQLEKHMGLSLKDVATRSDIEGLKIVEAHLEEMARQLDQTQGHLGRLDNIETQLSEVVEHLAAQFETRAAPTAALAPAEFQRMAEEAAETVAHRFAGSFAASATGAPAAANDDQLDSLRGLLESYISERRDGDEHSALMLDTM